MSRPQYAGGRGLSEVGLEILADLAGSVIRTDHRATQAIDAGFFQGRGLRRKAVLIHTAWDHYWTTESYFERHPYVTEDAARYLVKCGVKLVGIDKELA